MKTRVLKYCLLSFILCLSINVCNAQVILSDNFEDGSISNTPTSSTNPLWINNTSLFPISSTTPISGGYSLTSNTGNAVQYIYNQYSADLASKDRTWRILYDNTGTNPDDSNPITGKRTWRLWLAANGSNPSTAAGYYITHRGSTISLKRINSGGTTDIASWGGISSNTIYSIRITRRAEDGFWTLYIDAGTGEATTSRGTSNNQEVSITGNIYTILECNDNNTPNKFIFDNYSISSAQMVLGCMSSVSPNLYTGSTNQPIIGFQLMPQDNITFKDIKFLCSYTSLNSTVPFNNIRLYSSSSPTFAIASSTLLVSNGTLNSNNIDFQSLTLTIANQSSLYYFVVANIPTGFGGSTASPPAMTFSINSTSFTPVAHSFINFSGSCTTPTISAGNAWDWVGNGSDANWNTARNWRLNNNNPPAGNLTSPSPSDKVNIGVNYPYTQQPTINGTYNYSQINIGNNALVFTFNQGSRLTITNSLNITNQYQTFFRGTGNVDMGPLSTLTLTQPGAFSPGGINIDANVTFTLKSDASGSAAIAAIPTGASIIGKVNVERFITGGAGYRGYRLLSSPVNISSSTTGGGNISLSYINTTPAGTTTYGALTGGPGTGFSVTSANPTIYLYNENNPSSTASYTAGKNVGVTSIDATTVCTLSGGTSKSNVSIPVGNGFLMYFVGNNQSLSTAGNRVPENTTITATGTLNQGDVPVKLWFNGSTSLSDNTTVNTATGAGYNMVGNPYASSIDLNAVFNNNGSLYPIFCVLDIGPSVQYLTYNASNGATSGSHVSQYVASGQGFFVKATGTGQTLTFKEAQKTTTAQFTQGTTLLQSTPNSERLTVETINSSLSSPNMASAQLLMTAKPIQSAVAKLKSLHLKVYHDALTEDECGLYFGSGYNDKFDDLDAIDLDGVSPKVYISSYSSDNVRTSINMLADYTKNKLVKLFVYATTDGLYHLEMTDINNVDTAQYNVFLLDRYKKDSLDMRRYKTYNFNVIKSDTTSYGANRFVLAIERIEPVNPYKFVSVSAKKATKGVDIKWSTLYEENTINFAVEKQTSTVGEFTALYDLQSNSSTNYIYTDAAPTTGNNVYRIKQTNIFGDVTYSAPVSVMYSQTSTNNTSLFSVYPNPVVESINVNVTETIAKSPSYKMNIYSTSGLLMKQETSTQDSFSENVSELQPGIYIVELQSNDGKPLGKTKFVKAK